MLVFGGVHCISYIYVSACVYIQKAGGFVTVLQQATLREELFQGARLPRYSTSNGS